eukprot:31365-Pelagococcus_subviridis.AAC.20
MLDDEVIVRPLLEPRVERLVVLIARVFERPVEVRGVLREDVRRGEIRAAAEPPRSGRRLRALRRVRLEVPVVEVHRGRHRVVRVHHGGDARGEEGDHLFARALLSRRGAIRLRGHLAVHHGDVHARLLEDVAALEDAGDAAAAARARPRVLLELLAVELLDRGADLVLRGANHLLEFRAHGSGVVAAALAQERERGFVEGDFFFDRARGRRGRADGDLF